MDNLQVADPTQVSNSLLQNVSVGKRRQKTADSLDETGSRAYPAVGDALPSVRGHSDHLTSPLLISSLQQLPPDLWLPSDKSLSLRRQIPNVRAFCVC
jgi:hypothetical protein